MTAAPVAQEARTRTFMNRISVRIWLPLALVLSVSLSLLGIVYARRQEALLQQSIETRVRELARLTARSVELAIEREDFAGLARTIEVATQTNDFAYVAILQRDAETGRDAVFAVNPQPTSPALILAPTDDRNLRASAPIETNALQGSLLVAMSREQIEASIDALNRPLFVSLAGIVALTLASLIFVVRVVTRPVAELTDVAKALRDGRYDVEVRTSSRVEEVDSLATAFRELRDSLTDAWRRMAEANATLLQAKQEAEAADRAKSAFVANMSHEIRTPLNALVGLSHLCLQTPLSGKQRDYVSKIEVASQSLLGLVNNVLDFAKVEADALVLESEPFALRAVLARVDAIVGDEARAKGLALDMEIDEALPTYLQGDALRLQQVLTNLVGNAVKFTPSGSVRVTVERDPDDSGQHEHATDDREPRRIRVAFRVIDTGIGVSEEQRDRLFRPFSQADTSTTRLYGGTGLGLVISQRIVQAMGGTLRMHSVQNLGTSFRFVLDLDIVAPSRQIADSDSATPRSSVHFVGQHVLVVEDNPFNQQVARELLERAGLSVTVASDGVQALEALEHDDAFRLVLMDVQMPVMDGLEATRRIRTLSAQPTIPILAMTANVSPEDRRRCLDAGMNDVIGKPIVPARLIETLQGWLETAVETDSDAASKVPESAVPDSPASSATHPDAPLRLKALRELLEDDQEALQEVLERFLESLAETRAGVTTALLSNDLRGLAFHAHRFKSAAGQLEAAECYRLCTMLQDVARLEGPTVEMEAEIVAKQLVPALDQLERDIALTLTLTRVGSAHGNLPLDGSALGT